MCVFETSHYVGYKKICVFYVVSIYMFETQNQRKTTSAISFGVGMFPLCTIHYSYSPAVLSPGLEVNFATSTIFTAKICPV